MSIPRNQLLEFLSKTLSPELFDDYAPNGLQVEGKTELKRLAFAVSATQSSLKAALAWKADGLIVHHGILWKHQGARPVTGPWGERLRLCLKKDLNLMAYHLPLDAHQEVGNATALAKALKMTNLSPFGAYKKQTLGMKGELRRAVTAEEFKIILQQTLDHSVILASPDPKKKIKSIGIITGGANNEWSHALAEHLDAYITGEISEYNWHDAIEAGVHYFAGGHHATEKFGIQELMKKLKNTFPKLEVKFFDSENPA
jgi:dinuclear metal center YbgI/SA1388 family protein